MVRMASDTLESLRVKAAAADGIASFHSESRTVIVRMPLDTLESLRVKQPPTSTNKSNDVLS